MVESFASEMLPVATDGLERVLFLEPRLESGAPDLVAVYVDSFRFDAWPEERSCLVTSDVKVLHQLSLRAQQTWQELEPIFGSTLKSSLSRLIRAGLVEEDVDVWRARPVDEIFAVTRIIAVEAKVSHWKSGLHQAARNRWFASESYLLLPEGVGGSHAADAAQAFGVGLASPCRPLSATTVFSDRWRIPSSYVSWLFNEWAWRIREEGPG